MRFENLKIFTNFSIKWKAIKFHLLPRVFLSLLSIQFFLLCFFYFVVCAEQSNKLICEIHFKNPFNPFRLCKAWYIIDPKSFNIITTIHRKYGKKMPRWHNHANKEPLLLLTRTVCFLVQFYSIYSLMKWL